MIEMQMFLHREGFLENRLWYSRTKKTYKAITEILPMFAFSYSENKCITTVYRGKTHPTAIT